MSDSTTITVRLKGSLQEFVQRNVGEDGDHDNVSEYIRNLIRKEKERVEQEAFLRLKAELTQAFSAPDSSYQTLSATDIIARNSP